MKLNHLDLQVVDVDVSCRNAARVVTASPRGLREVVKISIQSVAALAALCTVHCTRPSSPPSSADSREARPTADPAPTSELVPTPPPTPTTSATAPPAPGGPSSSGAKLELRLERTSVKAGEPIRVKLVNAGDAPWTFAHPGASNGCGAFHWSVSLAGNSRSYTDPSEAPGRMCTMAIVPPRTIIVQPKESIDLAFDTDAAIGGVSLSAKREKVAPGTYDLIVRGGDTTVSVRVEVK